METVTIFKSRNFGISFCAPAPEVEPNKTLLAKAIERWDWQPVESFEDLLRKTFSVPQAFVDMNAQTIGTESVL